MSRSNTTKKPASIEASTAGEFSFDVWIKRQTQESGVPEVVEDAATLAKAATLAASMLKKG